MRAHPSGLADEFVYFDQLRGDPLELGIFERLSTEERQALRAAGRPLWLNPGHILFKQGTRHGGIFIIESGRVRTFYTSERGRELTIAHWTPNTFVGGPELFGRGKHCWSGQATEHSQVLYLSGDQLCELMPRMPMFTMALLDGLVIKGRCMSNLLQMLGTQSAAARLAKAILELAEFYGVPGEDGVHLDMPYTHGELAAMIGVTRQWVTMTLSRFRDEDLVGGEGRKLVIRDWDALKALNH